MSTMACIGTLLVHLIDPIDMPCALRLSTIFAVHLLVVSLLPVLAGASSSVGDGPESKVSNSEWTVSHMQLGDVVYAIGGAKRR